jgi:hypothetical protein
MGQGESTCTAPPGTCRCARTTRCSGASCICEKQNFETSFFTLSVPRVETGRFQARWVNCIRLAPPHLVDAPEVEVVPAHRGVEFRV